MKAPAPPFDGLPGEDLITSGLADLAAGRESVGALLVEMARGRLADCGLQIPPIPPNAADAEIRLYHLLGREHGAEAYARYNACLRQLSSFCRALEHRVAAQRRARPRG